MRTAPQGASPLDARQATVVRMDFTERRPVGAAMDNLGTVHLGGDRFRSAKGEVWHDPRGL